MALLLLLLPLLQPCRFMLWMMPWLIQHRLLV
jgi:hypothetical protein